MGKPRLPKTASSGARRIGTPGGCGSRSSARAGSGHNETGRPHTHRGTCRGGPVLGDVVPPRVPLMTTRHVVGRAIVEIRASTRRGGPVFGGRVPPRVPSFLLIRRR